MVDISWKQRLDIALEKNNMTLRSASIKAGRSSSYLHGMISKGKEPSVAALKDIAEALGVSATWLVFGVDLNADAEELVTQFSKLSEDEQRAVLTLTRSMTEKSS
ncbi:helix-turn-helix domain-containing protein [Brucella sp. HL-2]|nr:helix-turn-helix domain-containing protein [Brucella sp. HL-2]MCV9910210.1 helix-turn-helix domain-containing protein [Brucella sp. HL-2]